MLLARSCLLIILSLAAAFFIQRDTVPRIRGMGAHQYDLAITVIAIIAVGFVLLGVLYPAIAARLGLDEGATGHRWLSVLIGIALFALLLVYRFAQRSLATI